MKINLLNIKYLTFVEIVFYDCVLHLPAVAGLFFHKFRMYAYFV